MEETREVIQDRMICGLATILPIDKFVCMKAYIEHLSDAEFNRFAEEMKGYAKENCSIKEYAELQLAARKAYGVTSDNSALNILPLDIMSERNAKEVWDEIDSHTPSDNIYLTAEDDKEIITLWEHNKTEDITIPSDLFFANTVPLLDMRVTIDESDLENGDVYPCRIIIFEDYADRLKGLRDNAAAMVGAVIPGGLAKYSMFIPILAVRGVDALAFGGVGLRNYDPEYVEYLKKNSSIYDVNRVAHAFMETWYGIQIALLHPTVKNIFKGGRKERDGEAKFDKKPGTKRPVRYIKKRVINKDDIQRCLNGDGEAVNRHTLVWYVIGHWRKLANGTKQFIKPYWKGPLRELKMALDDREREIVTGGTANA